MRLRVGTRRSRLARTQTAQVMEALRARVPGLEWEEILIETTGDRIREGPLRDVGGKGLFVKELDEALLDRRIDCGVHSLKDVPTELVDGIVLAAIPERADPRDLLITRDGWALDDLPASAVVGTTSLRRAAQLCSIRPGLDVQVLRGNVETRLRRLVDGDFDVTLLAAAGLSRLGIETDPARGVALDPFEFVPAAGQGALAFTALADDAATNECLAAIDHDASRACVIAERAAARMLGGSCQLPVGAFAEPDGTELRLVGIVAAPDGSRRVREEQRGAAAGAEALGVELGSRLLGAGGAEIVAAVEQES